MLSYLPPDHYSCNLCGETKPANEYYARKSRCKACTKALAAENYESNREARQDRVRAYKARNWDRYAAYRKKNAASISATQAEWYRRNRDQELERCRQYRADNPDKVRKFAVHRRARKLDALVDPHVTTEWLRVRDGDACHYCGVALVFSGNVPDRAHLEHKVPLSRGGKHSESNCVLACRECNLHKGAMTDVEFIERAMQ